MIGARGASTYTALKRTRLEGTGKMKRTILLVAAIAAAIAVAGCSSPKGAKPSASGSGSQAAATASDVLDSFPQVTPESPNEKAVASKYAAYYASYVKFMGPTAQPDNPLYKAAAGERPQFIGYALTAFSPKDAKGMYGSVHVVVTGDHVQTLGASYRAADMALGQTPGLDAVLKNRSGFDARKFATVHRPVSAGEKHAVDVMKAWVEKNLAGLGYSPNDVAIVGYVLFWGEKPSANRTLYLVVQPDNTVALEASSQWAK